MDTNPRNEYISVIKAYRYPQNKNGKPQNPKLLNFFTTSMIFTIYFV